MAHDHSKPEGKSFRPESEASGLSAPKSEQNIKVAAKAFAGRLLLAAAAAAIRKLFGSTKL